jgi:hypothetical protein
MAEYNVYRVLRSGNFHKIAGPYTTQATADVCTQAMADNDHQDIRYCTVKEGLDQSAPTTTTTLQKNYGHIKGTQQATNPTKK